MFTGIIKSVAKPIKISQKSSEMTITFPIPKGWNLQAGESINIDGICSTVTDITKTSFSVFYMSETLKRTTLASLSGNHQFNLERSLKASDLMGGHFVSGHIDTTGKVKSIKNVGQSQVITISLDKDFNKYLIYKGSVAVNGTSLTVVEANKTEFSVSLIPHTLKNTNLRNLKIGHLVNIEVDLLSKYVEKLLLNK